MSRGGPPRQVNEVLAEAAEAQAEQLAMAESAAVQSQIAMASEAQSERQGREAAEAERDRLREALRGVLLVAREYSSTRDRYERDRIVLDLYTTTRAALKGKP